MLQTTLGFIEEPNIRKIECFPDAITVRLGEYGKQLEKLWPTFISIRNNGRYICDEDCGDMKFGVGDFVHGVAGRYSRGKGGLVYSPPNIDCINRIAGIGVISSDIEYEGMQSGSSSEDETFGCADFWLGDDDKSFGEFLRRLSGAISNDGYFTDLDPDKDHSGTVMFVFNGNQKELKPLIDIAMRDDQPPENQFASKFGRALTFPMPNKGLHVAVPIGLPANYIKYAVVNSKSIHNSESRMKQIQKALVVDGHSIPIYSI